MKLELDRLTYEQNQRSPTNTLDPNVITYYWTFSWIILFLLLLRQISQNKLHVYNIFTKLKPKAGAKLVLPGPISQKNN